jgi:hypothetical protein
MADENNRFLLHAGSDVLHKMKIDQLPHLGQIANTTRTECGALSTHMSEVSEEEADEVPLKNHCKHCFDYA